MLGHPFVMSVEQMFLGVKNGGRLFAEYWIVLYLLLKKLLRRRFDGTFCMELLFATGSATIRCNGPKFLIHSVVEPWYPEMHENTCSYFDFFSGAGVIKLLMSEAAPFEGKWLKLIRQVHGTQLGAHATRPRSARPSA